MLDNAIVDCVLLLYAIVVLPSDNENPDVDLRSWAFPAQLESVYLTSCSAVLVRYSNALSLVPLT